MSGIAISLMILTCAVLPQPVLAYSDVTTHGYWSQLIASTIFGGVIMIKMLPLLMANPAKAKRQNQR